MPHGDTQPSAETLIECRSVWKLYGPGADRIASRHGQDINDQILADAGVFPAVRDVTLDVCKGEIFVIMGLSGSGKSTLLRCMTGLTELSLGELKIKGVDLKTASRDTLIDIRRPEEWADTGIPDGAIALDMTQQETFLKALVALRKADATKPIALICRTGNRSGRVIQILAKQGFPGLVDVAEGVAGGPRGKGWKPRGLPTYKADITEIMTRRDKVLP